MSTALAGALAGFVLSMWATPGLALWEGLCRQDTLPPLPGLYVPWPLSCGHRDTSLPYLSALKHSVQR